MLSKWQINTNPKKKGFFYPTKCLESVLKYSYLVSIILNNQFPITMFADFVVFWSWILIALAHTLIAFAQTFIALAHTLISLACTEIHEKLCPNAHEGKMCCK